MNAKMKALLLLFLIVFTVSAQINVKAVPYKAAGNGVADDYTAVQGAIDAAANAGGGTVDLSGGNYAISKSLHWTAPDVYLRGDGAARVIPMPVFTGAAAVVIGAASATLQPTYRGGIENLTVDLSRNNTPGLIGVEEIQTWFTRIELLRIVSTNGLPKPIQTAFQMHGGALPGNPQFSNWSSNNTVRDLQISGSFLYPVRHVGGGPGGTVNGTNYFGGFAYGTAADKSGSTGFRIEPLAGDTTRVFGMALEDFDVGVYVGSQENGPLDFRIEGCNTPYASLPGITFSAPALQNRP